MCATSLPARVTTGFGCGRCRCRPSPDRPRGRRTPARPAPLTSDNFRRNGLEQPSSSIDCVMSDAPLHRTDPPPRDPCRPSFRSVDHGRNGAKWGSHAAGACGIERSALEHGLSRSIEFSNGTGCARRRTPESFSSNNYFGVQLTRRTRKRQTPRGEPSARGHAKRRACGAAARCTVQPAPCHSNEISARVAA